MFIKCLSIGISTILVIYKYINPVSFIVVIWVFLADEDILVAQRRWTIDMTSIVVDAIVAVVDGSNAGLEAYDDSGSLDEYICATPYFVHNIGLTGLIVIVTFLEHMWLYLYLCL